jgi:protein O-mannosyl-transferase
MIGSHAERPDKHRRTGAGAIFLFAIVVLAYLPALSAGYVWDDDALLTANRNVQSLKGVVQTWTNPRANPDYYPLTHTSFALEYQFWKLAPLGYHLDNILLHAANAILVWFILRRLAVPGAWVAAAIFALHPVQVEAVAWVSERKSVLGGFFCLLAMLLFLRVTLAGEDLSTRRRRLLYGLSLACFALALLARPVVMAAAAVLLLLVWWKKGRLARGDVFRIAWYWALAAVVAPVTVWVQYNHVGASGETFSFTALERVLIAGRTLWFYASKLAWPHPLIFCYDKWAIDTGAWWQWLFPAGAAAAMAALVLLRKRICLGPLVGVGVFVVMLSPALGFLNVYWHRYYFVADHMQYLACVGLIALAVSGAARLRARIRPTPWFAAAVALGVLGWLTWQQCGIYKDEETIWKATLRENPESAMAYNNLGNLRTEQGQLAEASDLYRKALRFRPDFSEPHHNLGLLHDKKGEYDQGLLEFGQALQLKGRNAESLVGRGNIYVHMGDDERAIRDFDAAVALAPYFVDAYICRGIAFARQKRYDRAVSDYGEAIRLAPDSVKAYVNRGNAYGDVGEQSRAVQDYDEAILLNPDCAEAYMNRGLVRSLQRKYDLALLDLDRAIQIKPDYAEAYNNRGLAYSNKGECDRAILDFDRAIALKPDDVPAYNNRGLAYEQKGEPDRAIQDYDQALRQKPDFALPSSIAAAPTHARGSSSGPSRITMPPSASNPTGLLLTPTAPRST